METSEWVVIQLELKYCERCGGLFLRRQGIGEVYCVGCAEQVVELRTTGKARSRPRLPVNPEARRGFEVVRRTGEGGGNA